MSMNHSSKPSAEAREMPGGRSLCRVGSSLERRLMVRDIVAVVRWTGDGRVDVVVGFV